MRNLSNKQKEQNKERSKKWRIKKGKKYLSQYFKDFHEKNKEERNEKNRQYAAEHREEAKKRAKNHWHSKPECERKQLNLERRLMQRFKRTPEWYEATLIEQKGHCALCDATPKGKRFHVDHNHVCCPDRYTCGKCVRGLLCNKCNTVLGYLELILKDALVFPMLGKSDSWTARALAYIVHYERKCHARSV